MFRIITANDHKLTLPVERKAFDDAETPRITSNRWVVALEHHCLEARAGSESERAAA